MWEPETRNNMLNGLKERRTAKYLPSNIYEKKVKGVLVRYIAGITINCIYISKTFGSTKFTLEENLDKAKAHLQEILKSLEVKII